MQDNVENRINVKFGHKSFDFHWHGTNKTRDSAFKILRGETYPILKGVNPKVIIDAGANIGAATCFFALNYPNAKIYSFEPASINFNVLKKNLCSFTNVRLHKKGLFSENKRVRFYVNEGNPERNSVSKNWAGAKEYENVQLINLSRFLKCENVETVDLIKIDTEGCELPIIKSMLDYLPRIQAVYLEYHSLKDKLAILKLLEETHDIAHDSISGVQILTPTSCINKSLINAKDVVVDGETILKVKEVITNEKIEKCKSKNIENLFVYSQEMGEMILRNKDLQCE